MVILPTEKRFDWQHAPLVLISIVVLNILVFFFYQSGDTEKLANAYMLYEGGNLFPIEWPLYQQYLEQNGQSDLAREYQQWIDDGFGADVAVSLLTNIEFNHYLIDNYRDLIPDSAYNEWNAVRPNINHIIESVSIYRFGLIPNQLSVVDVFAYQFLHGDVMHLLGNLFFLLVCGFAVEAAIGHLRFLGFYLVTGIVGGLSHAVIDLSSGGPLVGASGSISGVMAMYLGVFRLRKIEFFYWFFIFVGYFRAPALLILPIYIGKEVYSYISSDGSNVAYMAHAGGFIAGGLLIAIALWLNPRSVNEEYVETDQDVDDYQVKLDQVFKAIENFQFASALNSTEAMIKAFGLNFQLAAIRYNLGKIHQPENFPRWVTELLSLKTRETQELNKLQKVWREHPEIAKQLEDDKNIELGLRFSNKEQFGTAESIFKSLHQKQPHHPQLSLLAHKLSEVAKQLNEPQKQTAYLQFAKSNHGMQG